MKALAAVLVLALAAASPASAEAQAPGRDFLFQAPRGTLGLRVSWLQPRAGSDLYTFVSRHLTVERHDFNTAAILGEAGFALTPRVDVLGGLEFSRSRVPSHYRDFVDNTRAEITQRTELDLANVSGSVKVGLVPKGHAVSRLAWVPRGVVPYVGGGAGVAWYRFRQFGDFVDFQDFAVFNDVFSSDGWTPSAHLFGGTDVRVWRALALAMEARYVWAAGDLGPDFSGFDPIDLSGLRLSTGINLVF